MSAPSIQETSRKKVLEYHNCWYTCVSKLKFFAKLHLGDCWNWFCMHDKTEAYHRQSIQLTWDSNLTAGDRQSWQGWESGYLCLVLQLSGRCQDATHASRECQGDQHLPWTAATQHWVCQHYGKQCFFLRAVNKSIGIGCMTLQETRTRKLEAWCKILQKRSLHFMMLIPSVSGFIYLRHLQWIGYCLPSEQTCKSEVLDNHAFHQVSYCEEKVDCRRVMIMGHFGERSFTQRACNKTCDNCQNGGGLEHENRDVSQARPWLHFNMSPSSLLLYW